MNWGVTSGPVLVEQLRLLLRNTGSSVTTTLVLVVLLFASLYNEANMLALGLWCVAQAGFKLFCAWDSRRLLAAGVTLQGARRLVWRLLVLNAIDGLIWGALAWVTLDTTTLAGSILVVAVMGGVAGASLSSLSPVLPVFGVFHGVLLVMTAAKLWQLGDPAYQSLAVAGVLYSATLVGQARNSAATIRTSIDLRFENVELFRRARIETDNARAANLAKSKFLAAASHDLRQPIHAQGLFLGVLARTELSDMQRGVLASASAASQASAEMLNTLLDFSRIEAGVVDPQRKPFALQPLLKIENELAPQADAKRLIYRSREAHVAVYSDPALVELILRNLVSNAIRYTERGGIFVGTRLRGDSVVLEVWDTGIGIAESQQQEVFREFHQLGNPERDRRKGLGLGLAIAQGLARTLGHTMTLRSRPGRGSVFRLTLPVAHGPVAAATAPPPAAHPVGDTPLRDARVLVIDDDEAVRDGMAQLLRDWGCDCRAVEGIEDALEAVRGWRPDAVVSDYRLRGPLNGAQAIAALRQDLGDSLPALLVTGDTVPERLREAAASGVPLLHKPVWPTDLYNRLVGLLRTHAGST